jgi:thiamine transport system permease protein
VKRYAALAGAAGLVPLTVLLLFFVVPVVGMLRLGFWPDGRLDLPGLGAALLRPRVGQAVWFTLWSSALATAVTVVLGVPTAYALHRLALPGRRLLRALVAAPFVLPTVVVGVAFRSLLSTSGPLGRLGLDGTPTAIVAALVFFNVSVVVRTVGPWFETLDPRREQAAAALGATPYQVLRTVTLPALRPAVLSAASVVFLFCATAFGIVLTLGGVSHSTVETEIYLLTTQFLDLQGAAALSVLQVVAVVALLAGTGRLTRGSRALPVERTPVGAVRRPGRADLPVLAVTALVVLLVTGPLVTLVLRSLRAAGDWSLEHYRALLGSGKGTADRALDDVDLAAALDLSVRTALDATLVAVSLGVVVAVLVTRQVHGTGRRRVLAAFDGIFMLPLGVSAVTVGFGFLVTLDRPPLDLRGSPWLVPLAQALVALPLVVRILVPVLGSVDVRQREAAASLGADPLRVLASVDLPAAWRALLAATGLAFAVSLGEFGATSFLARPGSPTLPVLVYQLVGRPGPAAFGAGLAASVVLAAVTALVVALVERLGTGPRRGDPVAAV